MPKMALIEMEALTRNALVALDCQDVEKTKAITEQFCQVLRYWCSTTQSSQSMNESEGTTHPDTVAIFGMARDFGLILHNGYNETELAAVVVKTMMGGFREGEDAVSQLEQDNRTLEMVLRKRKRRERRWEYSWIYEYGRIVGVLTWVGAVPWAATYSFLAATAVALLGGGIWAWSKRYDPPVTGPEDRRLQAEGPVLLFGVGGNTSKSTRIGRGIADLKRRTGSGPAAAHLLISMGWGETSSRPGQRIFTSCWSKDKVFVEKSGGRGGDLSCGGVRVGRSWDTASPLPLEQVPSIIPSFYAPTWWLDRQSLRLQR